MQMMTEFVATRSPIDTGYSGNRTNSKSTEKGDFKEAFSGKLKEKQLTEEGGAMSAMAGIPGMQLLKEFEVNGKMMRVTMGEVKYDTVYQPEAEDVQPISGEGVGIPEILWSGEEQKTAENLPLAGIESTALTGMQTANTNGKKSESETENIMPITVDTTAGSGVVSTAKVEAPMQTAYIEEAVPVEDLGDYILEKLNAGKTEFEVNLAPRELGEITIKATMQAGEAVISIICKESETLALLSKSATDLAVIVENKLGSETQVVVESKAADYLEQQNSQNQNNQSENRSPEKQQNEKSEYAEQNDFLQQLRLGLQTL